MVDAMNADAVRVLLRERIADVGTAAAWCREHDISPQVVSLLLSGRVHPYPGILRALGLRRVLVYEPVERKR